MKKHTLQKEVMRRAWTIRKEAAVTLNCAVKDVNFSACLTQAWSDVKNVLEARSWREKLNVEHVVMAFVSFDYAVNSGSVDELSLDDVIGWGQQVLAA